MAEAVIKGSNADLPRAPILVDPAEEGASPFDVASGALDDTPTQIKSSPDPDAAEAAITESARELIGTEIAHFELLDCIGVGGMGRVFRARDTRLDRLVALKVLAPELAADPEIVRRFEQEAKAAARLDDPSFARVYFFGQDKGLRFMAMEYVEGENLRRRIGHEGRLDAATALTIGLQIAHGLMHAAALGVVHRDIKPSNIILTPQGAAKLVDMGLARDFLQRSGANDVTQANVTMGTLDYISPEQANDPRRVDVRADIYSLGCTLFHAVTGQPPYPHGAGLQKLMQHQNDPVPDARSLAPDVPVAVAEVLAAMMAKRPEHRPQTPGELIQRLRAASVGLTLPPLPHATQPETWQTTLQDRWQTHSSWLGPALVLLVALGAYAFLYRGNDLDFPTTPPAFIAGGASAATLESMAPRTTEPMESRPDRLAVVENEGRIIVVPAKADLRAAIDAAPDGATLRLTGTSYLLSAELDGDAIRGLMLTKSLTIEPLESRQWTRLSLDLDTLRALPPQARCTVVAVRAAKATLRRLWIDPPTEATGREVASLHCEGQSLHLDGCVLGIRSRGPHATGVHATTSLGAGSGSRLIVADTWFLGGDAAVRWLADSAGRVDLWNCAFGLHRQPFVFDGTGRLEFRGEHLSFSVGGEAPFVVGRPQACTLQLADSAIARLPGAAASAFMVAKSETPAASRSPWYRGARNLLANNVTLGLETPRHGAAVSDPATLRTLGFVEEQSQLASDWPWPPLHTGIDGGGGAGAESSAIVSPFELTGTLGRPGEGVPPGVLSGPWSFGTPEQLVEPPGRGAVGASPTASSAPVGGLVVDPKDGFRTQGVFSQLAPTCDMAASGKVILLRGELELIEPTIALEPGKQLTLRGTLGGAVKLRPRRGDPALASGPMFDLAPGAKLTLENLTLELDGDAAADALGTTLFRCAAGSQLVVDRCRITIGKSTSRGAWQFAQLLQERSASRWAFLGPLLAEFPTIRILHSQVRVRGPLLAADPADRWSLTVERSGIATDGVALQLVGPAQNRGLGNASEAVLHQSTFLLRRSLVSIDAQGLAAEVPRAVRFTVNDCAFYGLGNDRVEPFTTANGKPAGVLYERAILWSGDANALFGFDVLYRYPSADMAMMMPRTVSQRDPAEWLNRAGLDPERFHIQRDLPDNVAATIWDPWPIWSEVAPLAALPDELRDRAIGGDPIKSGPDGK